MKALSFGSPYATTLPQQKELPMPQPGPGEAVVRLRAAALNHLDLLVLDFQGKWHGTPDPLILGTDGAGEIAGLGAGVSGWQVGDAVIPYPVLSCGECKYCLSGRQTLCREEKIMGWHTDGTFAEYITVPARNLVRKPAHLSFEEAASLPSALGTAWNALVTQGALKPGQSILIHGVGGGVSLTALQLAVAIGAQAYVTSGSDEKLQRAREMGAAGLINYKEGPVIKALRPMLPDGADLVLDGIGKDTMQTSLMAASRTGRVVMIGASSGLGEINIQYLFGKTVVPGNIADHAEFLDAMRFYEHSGLRPVISHRFAFDEYEAAFATLREHRQFGKVVLTF